MPPCCLLISAGTAFKLRCGDGWFYAGGILVFYKHPYAFCLENNLLVFRSKSIKEAISVSVGICAVTSDQHAHVPVPQKFMLP